MFQRFRRLKNKTFEAGVDGADSHLSRNHGGEGGAPDLVACPYFKNSNLEGVDPQRRGGLYLVRKHLVARNTARNGG